MNTRSFRRFDEMQAIEQEKFNRWLVANAILSFFTVGLMALMAAGGFGNASDAAKPVREAREAPVTTSPTTVPLFNLVVPVMDRG